MYPDLTFKILDQLSQSLLVIDADYTPLYCNLAFLDLIEQSEHLNAFKLSDIFSDLPALMKDKGTFYGKINTVMGKTINVFISLSILDDRIYLLELSRLSSTAHDYQGKRLETLGLLSSSIVHDFNNLLAGIIGHVSFLKNILPKGGQHQASLDAIEQGSLSASEVTKEILRFSKQKDPKEIKVIEVNNLVSRTGKMLTAAINPKIKLDFKSAAPEVLVEALEVRLTQILINLIVNAQDAILESNAHDTKIYIDLNVEENPQCHLALNQITSHQGLFAKISVRDCGIGISQEQQEKIFQPYFSTKGEKGTGLGLTTVASIVFDLNGLIDIKSESGLGTEVIIYLPLATSASSEMRATGKNDPVSSGNVKSKKILVIDDEDVVRNVLGLNLQQLGYVVQLESSPLRAIDYYKLNKSEINLIILDMLMPELSGEEVFEIIREINPQQKILVVSGFCSEDVIEMLMETKNCDFLAKPFMIDELSRKIDLLVGD